MRSARTRLWSVLRNNARLCERQCRLQIPVSLNRQTVSQKVLIRLNPAHAAEATEKPEQYENEHHQAKNAAQPGPTEATMSIIPRRRRAGG